MENKITNEYGETWTKITDDDVITRVTKSLAGCDQSNLKVDFVAKVEEAEHLVIYLYGGKNGSGKWQRQMERILG